jgi:hypothetical protein
MGEPGGGCPKSLLGKAIAPREGAWNEKNGAAVGSDVGDGWGSEGTEHTKPAEHHVLSSVNEWIVCDDIPFGLNGVTTYLDVTLGPVRADGSFNAYVTFQNLSTGAYTTMSTTGTRSPESVFSLTFSGAYSRSLVFDCAAHTQCSRDCHRYAVESAGELALN